MESSKASVIGFDLLLGGLGQHSASLVHRLDGSYVGIDVLGRGLLCTDRCKGWF